MLGEKLHQDITYPEKIYPTIVFNEKVLLFVWKYKSDEGPSIEAFLFLKARSLPLHVALLGFTKFRLWG
jgi:hypothetical protein